MGCRVLFAPPLLGHDARRGRDHLRAGAAGLPFDERPLIFAAWAYHLLDEPEEARRLLTEAIARTPANPFAPEALRRLEAGEEDPFRQVSGQREAISEER